MFRKRLISYFFILLLNVPALIALSTCFENNFAYAGNCPDAWSYNLNRRCYSPNCDPCASPNPCSSGRACSASLPYGSPSQRIACCGPTPSPTPPPPAQCSSGGNVGDRRCTSTVGGSIEECQRVTNTYSSWTPLMPACASYEMCQGVNATATCVPCTCTGLTYGQSRCNGNSIETCTAPSGVSCSVVSSPCPSGQTCTGSPPTCTATPCIYCQTGLTVGESICTTNGLLRVCQRNNGVCSNSDTTCPNGGVCVGNNSSVLTGGPPSSAQCSATPDCSNTAPGLCATKPANGTFLASGSCAAGTTQNGQCCCPTPYPSPNCNGEAICPPGAAPGSNWICCFRNTGGCCPNNPNICAANTTCSMTSPSSTPTATPPCGTGQIRCPAVTGACCTGTACNGSICVVSTPTPTPNLCGPGNCTACITSCPSGCVIGRTGCTNPPTRKSESQKNLYISKNIEVKSQKTNNKKPKPCSSFKLKLEKDELGKTVTPVENICLNGGVCEEEDEICGVITEEDPQTHEDTYKCGCQKACEKLNPPDCSDGYAYPQTCGEIDDSEIPGARKCGVLENLRLDSQDSFEAAEDESVKE